MMMMMMNFIPVSLYLADANWEHGHNLRGTNWILKSLVACVADVRKERGREFGRETAREEEGRRGNACNANVFAIPPTNYTYKNIAT